MGCSTYTIKDFSSKDDFYKDFNNSVKDKDMRVTLMNDSAFTINNGIILEHNTLFSLEGKDKRSSALSNIKEIRYANNDSTSASIFFNNGEILRGKYIRIDRDSIHFTATASTTNNNIAPIQIEIDKVKTVAYKTRLVSSLIGVLAGGVAGVIVAVIAHSTLKGNEQPGLPTGGSGDASNYDILAPPIGALIGGIVGGIIGWNTIYQFNP